MYRHLIIRLLILFSFALLFINTFCQAADVSRPAPSWYEHVDLMQASIYGLSILALFFIARIIRQVDTNQQNLFTRMNIIEINFAKLAGEHEAFHGGRRKND